MAPTQFTNSSEDVAVNTSFRRPKALIFTALAFATAAANADAAIVSVSPKVTLAVENTTVGPTSACRLANGNFIATWAVGESGTADIVARRFSTAGNTVGSRFVVSADSGGDRYGADVACDGNGFVVIWQDNVDDLAEPEANRNKFDILARPYASNGNPTSEPALVNSYTTGNQTAPDICPTGDGTFIATWHNRARDDIRIVNFTPGVSAIETDVESIVSRDPREFVPPNVACSNNRVLVVWSDFPSLSANDEISARLYDFEAESKGAAFIVNADPTGDQDFPTACAGGDSAFVVSWRSASSRRAPGVIKARRVTAAGAPTGPGFELTDPDRTLSDLICGTSSTFATTSKRQNEPFGAYATFVKANNTIEDAERLISTVIPSQDEEPPAIAGNADQKFAVVWREITGAGTTNVVARVFERTGGSTATTTSTHDQPTSTTITTTTSFGTTTTSVTIPSGSCGDAVPSGAITTTDALAVLRGAVGLGACELCVCDVDGSGAVTVTDALALLRIAVGQGFALNCPACG